MNNWTLLGVKNLKNNTTGHLDVGPTQVKVKITHLLISNFDTLVYGGDYKAEYPKTLGRFATGIVTEVGEKCYGITKGERVYLESTRSCGKCYSCLSGKRDKCENIQIAGKDYDGFLRDFAVLEYTDVAVLPESVDNVLALCIGTVGIAENIYNKLNLSAGQKVAVIGADFMGNIIAQVLQYHKIIPIIIDNNPNNLQRAKDSGLFYAFPSDEELDEKVRGVTSGNMCDAAVYSSASRLPLSLPTRLISKCKQLVLTGFTSTHNQLDATEIIEKSIDVSGVMYEYNYTDTVINMLVHGAINIDGFEKEILTKFDPVSIFKERYESILSSNRGKMTILQLIFE